MAIATVNLRIDQGATYTNEWIWRQNGEPVDLTDYSARGHVRKTFNSPLLLDLTSYITLGDEGTITVEVPSTATEGLHWPGYARYDIELEDGDGIVTRLLEGKVVLSQEVTYD